MTLSSETFIISLEWRLRSQGYIPPIIEESNDRDR
jgi:hypothetical protein